jgi:glycosyltransferase involved in cell wall biosynthesis
LKEDNFEDYKLVLIGNGNSKPMEDLAAELNVSDHVNFLGNRSDVNILLQGFDCFVLPSRWEGLPLALIEAMACQLPVIASDVSGNSEVIEHGKTGLLFPSGDIETLKNAIKEMYQNPLKAKELAFNARAMINQKFLLSKSMDQYISLYQ